MPTSRESLTDPEPRRVESRLISPLADARERVASRTDELKYSDYKPGMSVGGSGGGDLCKKLRNHEERIAEGIGEDT